MATTILRTRANITVPKGANKKLKKLSFAKYFPKVPKINPNKVLSYAKGKVKLIKRKKIYKQEESLEFFIS